MLVPIERAFLQMGIWGNFAVKREKGRGDSYQGRRRDESSFCLYFFFFFSPFLQSETIGIRSYKSRLVMKTGKEEYTRDEILEISIKGNKEESKKK